MNEKPREGPTGPHKGWHSMSVEHRAVSELLCSLNELATDLEEEIDARYGNIHPAMQRRYDRDMEPVRKARELLAKWEGK